MCLPTTQVDRFYKMWRPLIYFANAELTIVPELFGEGSEDKLDITRALKIRDALWMHEEILDQYIAKNPAQLSQEDLAIVESWKCRRQGQFIIFKILKKHAIFISQDQQSDVLAVKGLYNTFEEMLGPYIPLLIDTVLLPFDGDIIIDGLIRHYNLMFGSGIQGELKDIYDDAKERGAIITTLLPNRQFLTRESMVTKAEKTNAKVMDAFLKHLYKSGRSQKTVERDTSLVERFSKVLLLQIPDPLSLRDFGEEELKNYVAHLAQDERKTATLSLKRFIIFSRDTGRLAWDAAENMLDIL